MKSIPWSAMLAVIVAASAPSSGFAGILYPTGSGSASSAGISLLSYPANDSVSFLMPTVPIMQAALAVSTGSHVRDGEAQLFGGMYSDVEPLLGYIAIVDGSRMELTPGETLSSSNSYGANGVYHGIRHMGYLPNWAVFGSSGPDANLNLSSQFKATGWLAPGAAISVTSTAYVDVGISRVASLGVTRTWRTPGAFELDYSAWVPFTGFNLNAPGSFALDYTLTVTISGGEGPSWVVLDPGAGTGSDPSNLFPWIAQAVPEPSTFLLGLMGLVSAPWLRRCGLRRSVAGSAPDNL